MVERFSQGHLTEDQQRAGSTSFPRLTFPASVFSDPFTDKINSKVSDWCVAHADEFQNFTSSSAT